MARSELAGSFGQNGTMLDKDKYARIERERRFLLRHFPADVTVTRTRRITDRYIEGTSLRLREQQDDDSSILFKLTKKISVPGPGAQQGLTTNIYLTHEEFCLLAQLPAKTLSKTRYSVPPLGIDVFKGALEGLILAEAEFDSPEAAGALLLPFFVVRDVSTDSRFTGGCLVRAQREELLAWLLEYGVEL
jgi:CYTH domain-containing protein